MYRNVGGRAVFFALWISSILLVGCGKEHSASSDLPTPSGRLVSSTQDFPPVVMVLLPGSTGLCTGTIVSSKAVLTAAHCTKNSGSYQIQLDGQSYYTSSRTYTGQGVVESTDDIAILDFSSSPIPNAPSYALGREVHESDTVELVGYGCNNIDTKSGAGIKRAGQAPVAFLDDYLNFLTPQTNGRSILGPDNRAGSCFGDSGGPALRKSNGAWEIVGVTHAGGDYGNNELISQYTNVATNSSNRAWLQSVNSQRGLGILGL